MFLISETNQNFIEFNDILAIKNTFFLFQYGTLTGYFYQIGYSFFR